MEISTKVRPPKLREVIQVPKKVSCATSLVLLFALAPNSVRFIICLLCRCNYHEGALSSCVVVILYLLMKYMLGCGKKFDLSGIMSRLFLFD